MKKFKLPKFNFVKKGVSRCSQKKNPTLIGTWRRFVKQIPADSRNLLKSHKHFIVFGGPSSGKSELIKGLVEQSEDLFPFDTTYSEQSTIQYYFGPKQIIQEVEFPVLEDRSIKARKQVIRLWKKLFQFREPIVVIVQDWTSDSQQSEREVNRLAHLIGGKLSLLSAICKKPIKVRLDLTHLDKIEGYLDFANYLKQQDLSFSIPLDSHFEINDLEEKFRLFRDKHLPSMLTTLGHEEFMRIQAFFKEIPTVFPKIEEFLRAIVTRARTKGSIDLEMLTFSSNREGNSSSNPFVWEKEPTTAIFFKYPMLKHQVAAACLTLCFCSLVFKLYQDDRTHLTLASRGVDLLRRCEVEKFEKSLLPLYTRRLHSHKPLLTAYITPQFFCKQRQEIEDKLVGKMYKQILEPKFFNMLAGESVEVQYIYFLGLMYATKSNDIGAHFLENLYDFSAKTGLDPNFIKAYIFLTKNPGYKLTEQKVAKINPSLPLTDLEPWVDFMKYFDRLNTEPVFAGHNLRFLKEQAVDLLTALGRLKGDPIVAFASVLEEDPNFQAAPASDIEHVQTLSWVYHNRENLKKFLSFVRDTVIEVPDVQNFNISQFFTCIKEIESINNRSGQLFNFIIDGRPFSFESKKWADLVISHVSQRAMQDYVVKNINSGGRIFFAGSRDSLTPAMALFTGAFPFIQKETSIPAKFSRAAYEKNVRMTAEVLLSKVDELPVHSDEKMRFHNFLRGEVVSYIKGFQKEYLSKYDACGIEEHSKNEIKKTLKGLLKTTAPFYDFLQGIHYHNGAFSQTTPCLNSFEELNQFDFLANIFDVENQEEALEPYFSVIRSALSELEEASGKTLEEEYPFLAPYLSPIANISLQILQKHPNSYFNKVEASLDAMGVPERFRAPFLQPFDQLYSVGLVELKESLEGIWEKEMKPTVCALFEKFPFNLQSERVAGLQEVEKKLNPTGELWGQVRELISAVCFQRQGEWISRAPTRVQLNQEIFQLLSRFTKATQNFWDKEGNRQPLVFKFRPMPFTDKVDVNPVPVCSYVRVGDQMYYNFNQSPVTETLELDWWEPLTACVGVELFNQKNRVSLHRTYQEPEALWSLFRLLKKGGKIGEDLWSWDFPNNRGEDLRSVSIYFETAPDELFGWVVNEEEIQ